MKSVGHTSTEESPDLIYSNDPTGYPKAMHLKKRFPNSYLMLNFLDVPWHLPNVNEQTKLLAKHFLSSSDAVTTISHKVKKDLSNFINKKAFLGTSVIIGNNNIINSEAVVEHETAIKNHSHIGPKCVIGGRAEIGNKVLLGLGSKVLHRVKICDDCTIGAGTIVNKDINYPGIYVGIPARRIVKEKKEICKKWK